MTAAENASEIDDTLSSCDPLQALSVTGGLDIGGRGLFEVEGLLGGLFGLAILKIHPGVRDSLIN